MFGDLKLLVLTLKRLRGQRTPRGYGRNSAKADNGDRNLGCKTFLNGKLVSDIVIDSSTAATDTIDYVATDNAGNT